MAEPALLDPAPFDLRHYLFDPDLPLAGGGLPLGEFAGDDACGGLDFDLPADFSVDDFLLRSPDRGDDDSGEGSAPGSGPAASSSASPATTATISTVANAGTREVKQTPS